ncbi:hypothetical protein P8452_26100 [Trifolium repens]|nr:hypothetical protein P8452_26100 [Trifolium repens]
MIAIGFSIPENSFTSLMEFGPHCLAPSSYDLSFFGHKGHYPISRASYLVNKWKESRSRDFGRISSIHIGKQFEWLTSGRCKAGKHEMVVTDKTIDWFFCNCLSFS